MIDHPDFVRYPEGALLKRPPISERLAYLLRLKRPSPIEYPEGLIRLQRPVELKFDLRQVLDLANHAARCPENRPSMAHWHDRNLWLDTSANFTRYEVERLRGRHIDTSKIPPALDLVKDHGVYLMSNGIPVQRAHDGRGSKVAYAEGFDPFENPDWEDFVSARLGRKDFSIPVPLSWIRKAQSHSNTSMVLLIDRKGLHLK